MGEVGRQHEPWAIRVPGDEAVRKAGDNLRAWAGDQRSPARRFFDRLTLRELADPKLAGAWGEEKVARELARLGPGWTTLHGVRVGPKADVDHLVIGPAGVFSMNTKRLASNAKVVVTARQFYVNDYSRDYYPKAVTEAQRVADRLTAAVGSPVAVQPVLVIAGVDRKHYRVKAQPDDVAVLTRRELRGWLSRRPKTLSPQTVALLANKARHPSTWVPAKVVEVLDVQPVEAHVGLATEPRVDVDLAVATEGSDVSVVRWRRYGHDRLYVNDETTGRQLAWRDEKTGEVHLDDTADVTVVNGALRRWDTARP